MNGLNFILNMFLWFIEVKEILINNILSKTIVDIIVYVSNIDNLIISDYYVMENIKKEKKLKLRGNENFKILINNYILKDYNVFSFSNLPYIRENEIISLTRSFFIGIESLLIGFQKFVYEYINYLKHLFNWYINFKILIDKNMKMSNIREELYYNISLELISEAKNEQSKALWWSIKNRKELKQNILIHIIKNYFNVFKQNPYRITIELFNLYKKYSKVNILSYGLDYDINILTHNKYILSNIKTDISSVRSNFMSSDQIIKNINKAQYSISKNNLIWKEVFEIDKDYGSIFLKNKTNKLMAKFVANRLDSSENFVRRTFTKIRLLILNNNYFNLDFIKNSILVYSESKRKIDIHYPIYSIYWNLDKFPINVILFNEKIAYIKFKDWGKYTIFQPDILLKFFLQWIPKSLIGVKAGVKTGETVIPAEVSEMILGKTEIIRTNNLKDMTREFKNRWRYSFNDFIRNTKRGMMDLYKVKKMFGGYSYWWSWHRDFSIIKPNKWGRALPFWYFQEGEWYPQDYKFIKKLIKEAKNPRNKKLAFKSIFVIGEVPFYYAPRYFFPEININYEFMDKYRVNVEAAELHKAIADPNSSTDTILEKMENLEHAIKFQKKRDIEIELDKKKLLEKEEEERIARENDVMEDSTTKEILEDQARLHFKGIDLRKYQYGFKKYQMELAELDLDARRKKRDPLGISTSRNMRKKLEYKYLTDVPEGHFKKVRITKKGEAVDYMKIKGYKKSTKWKKDIKLKLYRKFWRLSKSSGKLSVQRSYRKKTVAIHGNIGLQLIRKFFKHYLIANDMWVKFSIVRKGNLLWRYKPISVTKKTIDNVEHIIKKWPTLRLKKELGNFVTLEAREKYRKDYKVLMTDRFRRYAGSMADLLMGINYIEHTKFQQLYNFIWQGDMWNKIWLREAKSVAPSWLLSEMPKLKYLRKIKDFGLKTNYLLKLKINYNTPVSYKKIPLKLYTTEEHGVTDDKRKVKFYILNKVIQHYFYPESIQRLEKVKLKDKKADVIFSLKMDKKAWIRNMRNEDKKYVYDLKMKYNLYKNVIRRNLSDKLSKTVYVNNLSKVTIRGALMHEFNFNVFNNPEYLSTMAYLRRVSTTIIDWNKFYYTNIESVTEPLNLNIINKDFYGKNLYKEDQNNFLHRKEYLVNDKVLSKKNNILLKKTYIRNLINVYEEEDNAVKNYIYYVLIKEDFKVIYKFIWMGVSNVYNIIGWYVKMISQFYWDGIVFFFEMIIEELLLRFREVRRLKKFIEQHPEFKTYIIISIIFFIYVIISIFLTVVIKTFLPKNLIYGISYKKEDLKDKKTLKDNLDILYNHNKTEDNKIEEVEDIIKIISELEGMLDVSVKKRKKIHKYIKRRLKRLGIMNNIEINTEYLKKLELHIKLKKKERLKLKKNFFDAEHKYVYSWENKNYNLLEYIRRMKTKNKNSKKIMNFEDKRFIKKRVYINKLEKNKINELNKKYGVLYTSFIFEKNLEKWENNTKRRLDFFFNKDTKGIVRLLLTDIWRAFLDRRFNHNRMLFWDDPDLDDTSKIIYMFEVYKPFFNIFFIIKFTLGSIRLWDYSYWIAKWKQYVMYGVHAKINYKDLRGRLEKEWSLEWYKDEADYGRIQFKDFVKIIKKYKNIKQSPLLNKEHTDREILKKEIIENIIELDTEKDKFNDMKEYLLYLKKIEEDRKNGDFNSRFKDIAKKLIIDVDKIGPRKWAEQELRFKYRNKVYEQKLKIETEEYEVLKKSYTSRVSRDIDDKHKSLETLQWSDAKKVDAIMKQKIAAIKYEKNLREYNYYNKFIDLALDAKEKVFYESIKEYNEDLSEAYLNIREEEKKEIMEENLFEKKSRKLFNILDQNYIWFRWFTTMGSRFNYIFVLIISIFVGWIDNIKRIRKNELSVTSLIKIMKADFVKYIYKAYWEYLIIWDKFKISKKLGYSIIEILKFSIIITPIIFYTTFLYSIFIVYFILIIIFIIYPRKIYEETKAKIIKIVLIRNIINIVNYVYNYLLYIGKIMNLLFKNIETGETIGTQIYNKFYKICGKLQYNIYMLRGAFELGYKNNNEKSIKKGIISMKNLLKLNYDLYIQEWKENRKTYTWKSFLQKIWKKNNKIKDNLLLKIQLLKIIIPIRPYISRIRIKIWYFFYFKIGRGILKVDYKEYIKIYNKNFELLKKYYTNIINLYKSSIDTAKTMKLKDLIILIIKTIIKTIWSLLILPFIFIINHQKWKYINNYKKGIQGFRENPMYIIIDNPKKRKKDNWQIKLHNILMEKEISNFLKSLLYNTGSIFDIFFMFKIDEVKWTNKNYFQDYFWRKWYWRYKEYKEYILNYIIDIVIKIEENYETFEENVETRNWTYWERFKYAKNTYKLYKHTTTRRIQQKKSRDIFFYNKIKEKRQIMRVYFIKGMINWISYISRNKVVYTKVYGLKKKKYLYKYKGVKYKIKDIKVNKYIENNIHITEHLRNTPPQLWSLIIMYEIYYKTLLRYRYEDENYPTKWIENEKLEYKKDYKWRLASPKHIFDAHFYDRRFIAADLNNYDFIEFVGTLASEPYDPLVRWIIFLLEYDMSIEDVITAGDSVWNETLEDNNFIWSDISLTQLLTYNKEIDEFRYEIKNFNRLMIKPGVVPRVMQNTYDRDRTWHYFTRYRALSEAILKENEHIMKDMLKERRLIRAKMLHRALVRNKLKSKFEKDQEDAQVQEREFYFAKKKEFFEDLLIEEFWDWQAEYDEGIREDKYFHSKDLENISFEAQIQEEFYLRNRKKHNYRYLIDHITLQSYDQTMEEINYFLALNVLKILEKESGIKQKQININFKNLNISNDFLSQINYDVHLILKHKKIFNKKENKDEYEEYYEYKYDKLEWETPKNEAIYGFMESNVLNEFFEGGEVYTYEQKIENNIEASKYARPAIYFHGQKVLQDWMKRLSMRNKTLKNIRKKSIRKKRKVPLNIAYINNIKWTWEQWLIFSDVEVENEMLRKNTVILNERLSLWNLKQVPVRIKLPVILDADLEEVKDYIAVKSNYMSFLNHRHIMMLSDISPLLKQGLVWEECKVMLESRFNKNIQDLILWLFTSEALNRETFKIRQDYDFVFKNFVQNYGVFHKLYFVGMPQYTWDLIRYHEAWMGRDEFPYDRYYKLKQIEYINHDPSARKIVRYLHNLYLDKYSPISFVWFFKNQYYPYYWYHIYGFFSIISFIWAIKILMYNPGEYISEQYILYTPILLTILFWYLRRRVKNFKELKDSGELYLYKYHSTEVMDNTTILRHNIYLERKKQEWTEHFYDADKILEIFPEGIESFQTKIEPDMWRYHTHRNKYSDVYFYTHAIWWSWLLGAHFWTFYWGVYQIKHRNVWWLWDHYRYDGELVEKLRAKGLITDDIRAPKTFAERQWYFDSWTRLENGGNLYTRWYENIYRIRQGLPKRALDYGHDWQVIQPVKGIIFLGKKSYNFPGSNADINWIVLSRFVEGFNALPPALKDFKKIARGYIRRKYTKVEIRMLKKKERIKAIRSNRIRVRKRGVFRRIFDEDRDDIYFTKFNKDITKLEELKQFLKDWKFFLKEEFKKWYRGEKYIKKNHPNRKFGKFLYWIEDNVGFKTLENVYPRFLLNSWKQTKKFIEKDKNRYLQGRTSYRILDPEIRQLRYYFDKYFNIVKYIKTYIKRQEQKREEEILMTKSKCFYKGEKMDMRTLLSISDIEMHIANLRFFLLKSTQYRILKKLRQNKKYYVSNKYKSEYLKRCQKIKEETITEIKIYDTLYKWAHYDIIKTNMRIFFNRKMKLVQIRYYNFRIKKIKEIELYKILYRKTANKLKRYYNYLKDVPKRLDNIEKNEYRYNIIVNFYKERKDFWIFIKDVFYEISLWDCLTFIVKIIWKLFE